MPASFDSLDMQLNNYRDGYKRAISFDNWILGTHYVYLLNMSSPPPARITDMPPFKIRKNLMPFQVDQKAQYYCLFWLPRVEFSLSKNRDKIIKYFRDSGF